MELKETEAKPNWTVEALCDVFDTGGRELMERINSGPLPDDEDAAAAKKDYEEGPQEQVGDLSLFEFTVIRAAMNEDADAAITSILNFLFDFDVGDAHKEKRLAAEDSWKDKPYRETVPAPIASALKFGKDGITVSWGSRLMWLIIVFVLNWLAWAIIR